MKYLALLRGINVGGNSKVDMKTLKTVFESLGFENVVTYINSGNVIFDSGSNDIMSLTNQIESAIEKTFSLKIKVLIRTRENISQLCNVIPSEWQNNTEQKTDILFLWEEYDSVESIKLIKTTVNVDTLIYTPGAIIWNVDRAKYNQSGMHKFIGSVVYKNMTARNVNTVRKLSGLMS